MFPSQPQIGQYMAKERQELAARIRQAESASARRGRERSRSTRRRWTEMPVLKRRLAWLRARLG